MKQTLYLFLICCIVALTAAHPHRTARERADDMVDRIEKSIELTDAQENKLEQIYTDYYNRLDDIRHNNGTKADEQQLYNSVEQSVLKELTPSQQAEFNKLRLKSDHGKCKKKGAEDCGCQKTWKK